MSEKTEIFEKMQKLRRELTYHARLYYVYDAPEISDYDYDMMFEELKRLEAAYPEFFDPESPTQRVGGKALDKFSKVTHTARMDSLSDVFSFEELEDFINGVKKTVPSVFWSVEPKIDGLSVSLRYEKGIFVQGATRGDGVVGENETHLEAFKEMIRNAVVKAKNDDSAFDGIYTFDNGTEPPSNSVAEDNKHVVEIENNTLYMKDNETSKGLSVYFDAAPKMADERSLYFKADFKLASASGYAIQLYVGTLKLQFCINGNYLEFQLHHIWRKYQDMITIDS